MFRNYIITALRHLLKNKSFSIINITGLTVGLTCCLLIGIYVKYELNYDNFQEKGDRIARVIMEYSFGGNINRGNYTGIKVGPSFKKNFPEVEEFVRMTSSKKIIRRNDKLFIEDHFVYADSTFFRIFSFRLLQGDVRTALSGDNKLVLTQRMARKYFGDEDPLGKTIKISSAGTDCIVSGIAEDCPQNSQIKFDFLMSFNSIIRGQEDVYWNANYITYLLLKDKEAIPALQAKIPGFMKNEMSTSLTGNDYLSYMLEPLKRVHLYSEFPGFEINGSITYVYIVCAVAVLILIIACFTFVNLSAAKSVERAKEIGIRKVTGAFNPQIFWQFIGESGVTVLLSACVSVLFTFFLLPSFNELIDRNLKMTDMLSFSFIGSCLGIVCLVSLLAGSYPAYILSSFQPVAVLKGLFKHSRSGIIVRKSLFVFQFVVSVFLVVCASVIQQQLQFIQNKKLGFDREHVVVLPYDAKLHDKYDVFKNALKQDAGIVSLGRGDFDPCRILGGYNMQKPEMLPDRSYGVFAGGIDEGYLEACGIQLLAGSNITARHVEEASGQDTSKKAYFHFLLNESAVKQMGWTVEEAIGKKMFLGEDRPGEVKGVIKDFHFSSLHEPIKPLILFPSDYANKILVKLSGKDLDKKISTINAVWKQMVPTRPFEYNFLDENYQAIYDSEIKLGKAMNVFTLLAILLACLGLFGLSSYNIQQRAKEIGILKVLGAPVSSIIVKLSGNFLGLVLIAIAISVPLSWLVMDKWLMDFSYRITISVWVPLLCSICSLFLAFVTISIKAFRAASENPVKNLRNE